MPVFIIMQLFQETNMYFKKLDEKKYISKIFFKTFDRADPGYIFKKPIQTIFLAKYCNTVVF